MEKKEMIDRIDHVGLVVSDLSKSIDFYTHLLGFQIIKELNFPGRKLVILARGDDKAAKLELLRYEETDLDITVPSERTLLGLRHIAFHVSNVAMTFERLNAEGVEMLPEPPFQQPDGPPIAFGFDPDGVLLEFTEID